MMISMVSKARLAYTHANATDRESPARSDRSLKRLNATTSQSVGAEREDIATEMSMDPSRASQRWICGMVFAPTRDRSDLCTGTKDRRNSDAQDRRRKV